MTSTLADLQRRNLEKMEATDPSPAAAPPPAPNPSNEVSIIPSLALSHTQSNEGLNDGAHDGASEVSQEQRDDASFRLSNEIPPSLPKARMRTPPKKRPAQGADVLQSHNTALKDSLNAQLREHLMEQLMPGGKGPVTRLNVEMPEDLHQRLKQHCVKTRTPIKGLINALIALYLDAEEA